jgi:hypothetical protein
MLKSHKNKIKNIRREIIEIKHDISKNYPTEVMDIKPVKQKNKFDKK